MTIRIVLADDHTLLREALREVLLTEGDFRIVGEAGDGESVVECVSRVRPDVVLLDVDMPRSSPVQTATRLQAVSPGTAVIVLTMYDEPQLVKDMLQVGISGYLHKGISRRDLIAAIHSAANGQQQVTMSVSRDTMVSVGSNSSGLLSEREQEVLSLVAVAMSNRQIAMRLSITEGTVKRHLRNIFGKLGAESRMDAVNKNKAVVADRYHRRA
ncbi:response regulator [Streptomonospora nanhaiensis]|uniref:response regulator n=1 Tax=Streptomonospora nanhaiensis TaxID=1323731 RepID=UPI0015C9C677|nr:response regulator transcription factor [Streptomonospora nanhaiensis]MBV2362905.1 response regulator transcription factor [Streptomonospora nanhaiensis]MBX9391689.1 response regulator transcription factor [Streptomonospora nanhaiensis]